MWIHEDRESFGDSSEYFWDIKSRNISEMSKENGMSGRQTFSGLHEPQFDEAGKKQLIAVCSLERYLHEAETFPLTLTY